MLAVARKVHRLQVAAIGTGTVIGPEAVEVGSADKESDAVAGTKHIAGIILKVGADDIVFLRGLVVVAVHIDVADTGLTVALGGHIDIGSRILCRSKEQAGSVVSVAEDKVTDVFAANWCLCFTGD